MSGETVNKAQAHIDAVNRAKTERLERHSGEHRHSHGHFQYICGAFAREWSVKRLLCL